VWPAGLHFSILSIVISTRKQKLNEFQLYGRVARKKPLISEKNRWTRIIFAKKAACA